MQNKKSTPHRSKVMNKFQLRKNQIEKFMAQSRPTTPKISEIPDEQSDKGETVEAVEITSLNRTDVVMDVGSDGSDETIKAVPSPKKQKLTNGHVRNGDLMSDDSDNEFTVA